MKSDLQMATLGAKLDEVIARLEAKLDDISVRLERFEPSRIVVKAKPQSQPEPPEPSEEERKEMLRRAKYLPDLEMLLHQTDFTVQELLGVLVEVKLIGPTIHTLKEIPSKALRIIVDDWANCTKRMAHVRKQRQAGEAQGNHKAEVTAPGLLSVKQVARILGMRPSTIYVWAATKRLPAIYLSGRAIKFKREVIDEYMRLHTTGRL